MSFRNKTEQTQTIAGSKILITGGTGTFGHAFLEKCLEEEADEIRIFSRDEKKQYDMAQMYKNDSRVKFFIGDVRDKGSVNSAMKGADFVFHAAAMKQVPSCEDFPMEAVKTNILGSDNVINSAIQFRVSKIICLSTDKAVYPTSAMGMTKAYMEKLAFQKAKDSYRTKICVTRFGNLIASRGSAVPLFIEQYQNGLPITITDTEMTRFIMTAKEAADLVAKAFLIGENGDLLVKRAKASTTGDLAQAVYKFLNLDSDYPSKVIGIRKGEKMHEALLTEEEASIATVKGDYVIVSQERKGIGTHGIPYTSDKAELLSVDDICEMIKTVYEEGQF